ncbi:hypothetical protein Tco_1023393, partial [Tanacetum coccineum]
MSSSHSAVTYTSESDVDGSQWGIQLMPGYDSDASEAAPHSLEYASPADDDLEPAEAQALPTRVLPASLSPDYSVDSELIEDDPQEADSEDDPEEEPFKEEEELPAPIASTPVIPDLASPSEEEKETRPFEEEEVTPTPPTPISPLSSHYLKHDSVGSGSRFALRLLYRHPLLHKLRCGLLHLHLHHHLHYHPYHHIYPGHHHHHYHHHPTYRDSIPNADIPPRKRARLSYPHSRFEIGESSAAAAARHLGSTLAQGAIERLKIPPKKNGMSAAAIDQLIAQRVADALADYEANRNSGNGNGNGNNNHDSGSDGRRTLHTTRVYTYKEFLNCQPLNFKGSEEAVGLAHWVVGHDATYEMIWKSLMKITEAYCPRSEIKKLEIELWNMTVK